MLTINELKGFSIDDCGDFWYCNKNQQITNYYFGMCATTIASGTIFISHMIHIDDIILKIF